MEEVPLLLLQASFGAAELRVSPGGGARGEGAQDRDPGSAAGPEGPEAEGRESRRHSESPFRPSEHLVEGFPDQLSNMVPPGSQTDG